MKDKFTNPKNATDNLEADPILADNGTVVIPDILCNAGGVTVSYFEWVQDRIGYFWPEKEVNTRLERFMIRGIYAYRFWLDGRGITTVKVEPSPTSLSTSILPPCF